MPLLSRVADPLLGVFTGVLAYYLYEINPRNGIFERDRLVELVKWKQEKMSRGRESASADGELRTLQDTTGTQENK
ncbi:hypothetical protein BDW22DRAFT_1354054 [Trametopsis cervina]|nr:hypothetical protein BDW22DRAFT_1354054 [Trametopsis cervina]